MIKRRHFLNLAAMGTALAATPLRAASPAPTLSLKRPPVKARTYHSQAVEDTLHKVAKEIESPKLKQLFVNCFPNTLDTTVDFEFINNRPDTFIITGDIDAMWLRDSTAQVWPYLPFVHNDEKIDLLIQGLINRQTTCILKDPYANAFYKDLSRPSKWASDEPTPEPGIHERKWEIDSLCYAVRLGYHYWKATGNNSPFDVRWRTAMIAAVDTFEAEQRWSGESDYRFVRSSPRMIDAPVFEGTGRPVKPNGLIASAFRPSDDATLFPFLIPSNIFAVISLRQLSEMASQIFNDQDFARRCDKMATQVDAAIKACAIKEHEGFGKIYAYEVDGFGNALFMDDANVPSLMSLAYLNPAFAQSPVYQNTRAFLLSDNNPYYLRGTAAEGQGSPHTGKHRIWPMGIILRAMTSQSDEEITQCLQWLCTTDANTGLMHEGFDKDDPSQYSRDWFAWANTLFGELILKLQAERPALLKLAL
ncbi:glycoside hydrolase family 125 protein [Simiduia sp. 21SJ11W-1]|uniref:glycoside hydrolase family 125 protein n=1 Tax=Simiduia sp. 21SJ11W-1 TaxID=2909669 RepID=UPI0020A13B54|nr:glycoside hydrolase family 125 protein [Simiduia sp. 21SJ11W-1]UTA48349.1 glycoside hydrolase family 125 protein [Simiduia sp. 21SJ11W-1]